LLQPISRAKEFTCLERKIASLCHETAVLDLEVFAGGKEKYVQEIADPGPIPSTDTCPIPPYKFIQSALSLEISSTEILFR